MKKAHKILYDYITLVKTNAILGMLSTYFYLVTEHYIWRKPQRSSNSTPSFYFGEKGARETVFC